MQYMLVHVIDDELAAAKPWDETAQASLEAWIDQTVSRRVNLHGGRLRPASDATTVKVRGEELLVTDGPFAETKEQVAGYDLLECSGMEEAVEWAKKHPTVQMGTIEVRPLYGDQPPQGLPAPAPGKRRYMMLVCTDPTVDVDQLEPIASVDPWVDEVDGTGARRFGSQLDEPGPGPDCACPGCPGPRHRRPFRRNERADRWVRHPRLRRPRRGNRNRPEAPDGPVRHPGGPAFLAGPRGLKDDGRGRRQAV